MPVLPGRMLCSILGGYCGLLGGWDGGDFPNNPQPPCLDPPISKAEGVGTLKVLAFEPAFLIDPPNFRRQRLGKT